MVDIDFQQNINEYADDVDDERDSRKMCLSIKRFCQCRGTTLICILLLTLSSTPDFMPSHYHLFIIAAIPASNRGQLN